MSSLLLLCVSIRFTQIRGRVDLRGLPLSGLYQPLRGCRLSSVDSSSRLRGCRLFIDTTRSLKRTAPRARMEASLSPAAAVLAPRAPGEAERPDAAAYDAPGAHFVSSGDELKALRQQARARAGELLTLRATLVAEEELALAFARSLVFARSLALALRSLCGSTNPHPEPCCTPKPREGT